MSETSSPSESIIPIISTDAFREQDDALLAIARVGAEDVIFGASPTAHGYSQLRANVYIDQTGFLTPAYRQPDGGEHDSDDMRSVHFVGLENRGNGTAAVVGAMRLIHKSETHPRPLPIEEFFDGEVGNLVDAPGSFEVSRYILSNPNRRRQALTKQAIMGVGLAHAVKHEWGPCVAVVSPDVARGIRQHGEVPITEITQPKVVEKYKDVNVGIQIDVGGFRQRVGEAAVGKMYLQDNGLYIFWRQHNERRT